MPDSQRGPRVFIKKQLFDGKLLRFVLSDHISQFPVYDLKSLGQRRLGARANAAAVNHRKPAAIILDQAISGNGSTGIQAHNEQVFPPPLPETYSTKKGAFLFFFRIRRVLRYQGTKS